MLQEFDIRDSASSSSDDESVGGVPNVLTSTTDTGSSGAESGGCGRGRGRIRVEVGPVSTRVEVDLHQGRWTRVGLDILYY